MVGRRSSRLKMLLSQVAQKKSSPKGYPTKKHGGYPREKSRASWNPGLEKALLELLHKHNTPGYRGQNGWSSEAWNKIVKEFNERHTDATFNKAQIKEKEKELKREYRMLKEARKRSGASWNDQRCMIEADAALWNNIIVSFPRAKKFRNKSFPLFDALGELYDGHTAEGTYNFTPTQPSQYPVLTQVDSGDEITYPDESLAYDAQENADARVQTIEDEGASAERTEQSMQKRASTAGTRTRNTEEKEKSPKKSGHVLEGMMERYIEMRSKEDEHEAARLAKEKETAQGTDFSIKRCISVLKSMEVTKEEKVKSFEVFKNPDNREIFLSCIEDDPETSLMWLKYEIAKVA